MKTGDWDSPSKEKSQRWFSFRACYNSLGSSVKHVNCCMGLPLVATANSLRYLMSNSLGSSFLKNGDYKIVGLGANDDCTN